MLREVDQTSTKFNAGQPPRHAKTFYTKREPLSTKADEDLAMFGSSDGLRGFRTHEHRSPTLIHGQGASPVSLKERERDDEPNQVDHDGTG